MVTAKFRVISVREDVAKMRNVELEAVGARGARGERGERPPGRIELRIGAADFETFAVGRVVTVQISAATENLNAA